MNITIPFYEVINRFLFGLLLAAGIAIFHVQEIMNWLSSETVQSLTIPTGLETVATICLFAVIYEIGYIINRISSVLTEELLIRRKVWPKRSDYVQFNKAKEHYKILPVLAREYDFCKGQITLFSVLIIYALILRIWPFVMIYASIIIFFAVSGWKFSERINSLVKENEEFLKHGSKKA